MHTSTATTHNSNYDAPSFIRSRMADPIMTRDEEAVLFTSIRRLHGDAWDAVLLDSSIADARSYGPDPEWEELLAAQREALVNATQQAASATGRHAREAAEFIKAEVTRTRDALQRATDRAVSLNLRFCVKIALRSFYRSTLPPHDRIQAAAMGCLRAARGFDPAKGWKFSTYANHWIRHAIQRAEQDTADTIRIPVHMHETRRVILASLRRAEASGKEVTAAGVAAAANRSVTAVRQVITIPRTVSTETRVGTDHFSGKTTTLGDFLSSETENAEDSYDAARELSALEEGIERLPPKVREVVRVRFGFASGEPETLKAIGERMGLSRERIRQLETEGVEMLRVLVPALATPAAARRPCQRAAVAR